jgi:hypothetical protein
VQDYLYEGVLVAAVVMLVGRMENYLLPLRE